MFRFTDAAWAKIREALEQGTRTGYVTRDPDGTIGFELDTHGPHGEIPHVHIRTSGRFCMIDGTNTGDLRDHGRTVIGVSGVDD